MLSKRIIYCIVFSLPVDVLTFTCSLPTNREIRFYFPKFSPKIYNVKWRYIANLYYLCEKKVPFTSRKLGALFRKTDSLGRKMVEL